MTQSLFLQVGQCGNQIGSRFWDLALREYASITRTGHFDETMQALFYARHGHELNTSNLSARAILVDMEEGVVQQLLRSPLGAMFDTTHLITDVSGSGNNWAVGNLFYGTKHSTKIMETLRKSTELCDSLQCFFLLFSLGGGTGSGIGSFITSLLSDEFPGVDRVVTAIFPSLDDDVITSPYNTILSLEQLTEFADCVVAVDNRALISIVDQIAKENVPSGLKSAGFSRVSTTDASRISIASSHGSLSSNKKDRPFDEMNNIVANMLLNLTSSSRFQGSMNVDLNELSINLVPFPRLHFLLAAQSPITSTRATTAPRNVDQIFKDAFSRNLQLASAQPIDHTFLASSLLLRGDFLASDIRRNIDVLKKRLRFVPWNREGWKVGHCQVSPVGQRHSLLALSNNTAICDPFRDVLGRFKTLLKKRAHLHHYLNVDGFEMSNFKNSANSVEDLIEEYNFFETSVDNIPLSDLPRLRIAD